MEVRFYGVRGSVAVSGPGYQATGGATTCVEVAAQGCRLLFDGGTGLRAAGENSSEEPIHLLFTHCHWDHIQGVPFFGPAWRKGQAIQLVGRGGDASSLRESLERQMRQPEFPVPLSAMPAQLSWLDVVPGRPFSLGPFRVETLGFRHPDGVLAYRVELDGQVVVFATDIEHGETLDSSFLRFAEGADLLIHDAQYSEAEYRGDIGPSRRGWGHSTWEQAVGVARAAGAAQLALFHHDPFRKDDAVAGIEASARKLFPASFAAREGGLVRL